MISFMKSGQERALFMKEIMLGLGNGCMVGLVAAIGMFVYARMQNHPSALMLALVVWVAMVTSCVVSGLSGAAIPLVLRKLGFDPATASPQSGTGFGLHSARRRLYLLFGRQDLLSTTSADNVFTTTIKIPQL